MDFLCKADILGRGSNHQIHRTGFDHEPHILIVITQLSGRNSKGDPFLLAGAQSDSLKGGELFPRTGNIGVLKVGIKLNRLLPFPFSGVAYRHRDANHAAVGGYLLIRYSKIGQFKGRIGQAVPERIERLTGAVHISARENRIAAIDISIA